MKKSDTYWVRVFIGGDFDTLRSICNDWAQQNNVCVSISPREYIYKGGSAMGAVIELINYPKRPRTEKEIWVDGMNLARDLRMGANQLSFTIMDPDVSEWHEET